MCGDSEKQVTFYAILLLRSQSLLAHSSLSPGSGKSPSLLLSRLREIMVSLLLLALELCTLCGIPAHTFVKSLFINSPQIT